MNYRQLGNALMATLVLAALVAPAARADSGPWIRWKQGYRQPVQRQYGPRYHGESGAGPAIAGFIGGLVLGSQLHSHTVVACPPPRRVVYAPPPCEYEYYDPYCDETFSSLDECYDHIQYEDYPMVVQQIDIRTGDCVDNYEWSSGRWSSRGRGFDYRAAYNNPNYRGQYDQRGYNRGGYDNRGGNNGWNGDRRYKNYSNGNGWNRDGRGNGRGNDNRRWNDNGGRGRNGRGHGNDQGGRDQGDQGD